MKKSITLILVVFLFSGIANAQLRYGIKGGLNVSSLSTSTSAIDQVKAASSYQGGLLMQLKLGSFAIQPELLYTVKSSDLQIPTGEAPKLREYIGAVTTLNYETQNIEIPVNLQLGMDFGPARIYAQAGPYMTFALSGALNGDVKLYDTVDENLAFNKFDWGFGIGAGAEIFGFQLALKYDFGMNPAGEETFTNSNIKKNMNPFYDMKNRNLNISLGLLF